MSYICVGASLAQPSGIDRYQPSRGVRRTVRIASAGTLTVEDCVRNSESPESIRQLKLAAGATAPSTAAFTRRTTSRTTSLASSPRLSSRTRRTSSIEEIVLLKTRVTAAAAADPTE